MTCNCILFICILHQLIWKHLIQNHTYICINRSFKAWFWENLTKNEDNTLRWNLTRRENSCHYNLSNHGIIQIELKAWVSDKFKKNMNFCDQLIIFSNNNRIIILNQYVNWDKSIQLLGKSNVKHENRPKSVNILNKHFLSR